MSPEVGRTSPMILAMVAVLPAPLPPSSPVMLPRALRNGTSSTPGAVLSWSTARAASIAAARARPRGYALLATLLRRRWLAVLGPHAATVIGIQGLEFDVPVSPCVTIVGLTALLNRVLQMAFNPMRRREPA